MGRGRVCPGGGGERGRGWGGCLDNSIAIARQEAKHHETNQLDRHKSITACMVVLYKAHKSVASPSVD